MGPFKSQKHLSYAFSLIPRDYPNRVGWKLVVVTETKREDYEREILQEYDHYTSLGFLFRVPPGRYEDVYKSQEVHLDRDGFQQETYGKGTTLYFWHNGRFRSLILVD